MQGVSTVVGDSGVLYDRIYELKLSPVPRKECDGQTDA